MPEVVERLRQQTFDADRYEIIVVDNNLSDALREFVNTVQKLPGAEVRYVLESRTGLHYAQHAGAKVARGKILAYTEDDILVPKNWLNALMQEFEDPRVGKVGGVVGCGWFYRRGLFQSFEAQRRFYMYDLNTPTRFSVIIPTYNRFEMLVDCLAAVRAQTVPEDAYEIIVVDNASQDATAQIVERLNAQAGKAIKYVYEVQPGLLHARHAGAQVARGDILAFIDDDVIVESDWLAQLSRAYEELNAEAAGGRIRIRWDEEPPGWIAAYQCRLGAIDLGPQMRLLATNETINGGNFSIRRQYLYEVGGFAPGEDCRSSVRGSSEVGLCRRIHARGGHIAWVPDALVWHCQMVAKHATIADLRQRYVSGGIGAAYERWHIRPVGTVHLALWTVEVLARAMVNWVRSWKYRGRSEDDYIRCELQKTHYLSQGAFYFRLIRDLRFRQQVSCEDWINR